MNMRKRRERPLTRRFCHALVVLALAGCSSYPFHMTRTEWETLTPEERKAAVRRQRDQDSHDAAAWRCHRAAEQKVLIGFKTNVGFRMQPAEIEVHLGEDWERFRRCMAEAGWDVPILADRDGKSVIK